MHAPTPRMRLHLARAWTRGSLAIALSAGIAVAAAAPRPAAAETPEEKGLSIAKQIDAANEGFGSESSTMTMVIINAQGEKLERKMDSRIKEMQGDGDRSLITFQWPADVKGTKMLTWSHGKESDDQWLFLPSLKRVKRIASRNKSGSFMGSEFAYEDLGSQEIDKYTYKWLRDEDLDGRPCWVVERVPTDPKSGYSKMITWLDQGYNNAVKIEFYDRKDELLKTMRLGEYKAFGKYHRAGKITVENHQTAKKSELSWADRTLGAPVSEAEFDSAALDR